MRAGHAIVALHLSFACTVLAEPYRINDTFIGYKFADVFEWWTGDDPTHGRVNYVDKITAFQKNLSYVSDTKFIMRADSFNAVPPDARGRDSVRIYSDYAYGDAVMVLDIVHMPAGCATWPAFWTISEAGPWPHGGEIDIIEGVNLQEDNLVSLHTTPNCTMLDNRNQTGQTVSTDCNAFVNSNQGCGTSITKRNSYGADFNSNGGGWYVMERSPRGVNVWFYSRDDHDVPEAVRCGHDVIDPNMITRTPDAEFPWDQCDYAAHFDAHAIIFDLTFCGDWAGGVYDSSGCGPTPCNDFVNNNPSAFTEAYWEINSLRIYTPLLTDTSHFLEINSLDGVGR